MILFDKQGRPTRIESAEHSAIRRRDFLKYTAAGMTATLLSASLPPFRGKAQAAKEFVTTGLSVSIIKEIQDQFTKDKGIPIRAYEVASKDLHVNSITKNDVYDVDEEYQSLMKPILANNVWQPIDTGKIQDWGKIIPLFTEGRMKPEYSRGQGDSPELFLWADKDKGQAWFFPTFFNMDSIGYNPDVVPAVESWGELWNPKWAGRMALVDSPTVAIIDAVLSLEAIGVLEPKDRGNLTKDEIDAAIDFLIEKKKGGHIRALWSTFGESVNLAVSGEVVIMTCWSPAVTAIKAQGVPFIYASPKEGYRGWSSGFGISAKTDSLEECYTYINWWAGGWPGAFVARQGYYFSVPENVKPLLSQAEWDYWYDGKPAAEDIKDPYGNLQAKKDEVRDGGSFEQRTSRLAVWNTWMDEAAHLTKRWTEFIAA